MDIHQASGMHPSSIKPSEKSLRTFQKISDRKTNFRCDYPAIAKYVANLTINAIQGTINF